MLSTELRTLDAQIASLEAEYTHLDSELLTNEARRCPGDVVATCNDDCSRNLGGISPSPPPARRRLNHQNVPVGQRTPQDYTLAELNALDCVPRDSYTNLTFEAATLVLSNLGGQGGRCVDTCYDNGQCFAWSDLCEEEQPSTHVADSGGLMGNMHVLFRGIGFAERPGGTHAEIWLRIVNETEYRAWNPRHNGVKRVTGTRRSARAVV